MQAQTLTPFQLFGNQVRYVVPMFQRPYIWNEEKQWQPLWDDIRTLADRLLQQHATGSVAAGAVDIPPHFLGAIVLDQQLVQTIYIPVRHVIDGQQRLTTLQLLLDAAQAVMQRCGDSADASALAALVLNNAALAQKPEHVFKVWPTNRDREAFCAVMDDSLTPSASLRDSGIVLAHHFFAREIEDWAETTADPDRARLRLHALGRALTQYLKLVVIDLEPGDNAQVIFETLNHRGTPLLAADLVKNLVFQRAELEQLDVDALYEDLWRPFDTDRWRRLVRQGRLFRPRIDVFLNYWLTMRLRREVPTDRVFSDFREHLLATDDSVYSAVGDLARSARTYDDLEGRPFGSVEGTFYYRVLSVMEQHVLGPLLLWLFDQKEEVPLAQRQLALRAMESWLVRRMICRLSGKQTNQLVVELLGRLHQRDSACAGEEVVSFLATQDAESRLWPTDDQVRAAVRTQPLYAQVTRARLRMVLEALEDSFRTPKSEEEHCVRGKLTIEHVMPQGWREHWRLPSDGNRTLLEVERDRIVHTLGNLTLVTKRLNPELSNRPWTDEEAHDRLKPDSKGKRTILSGHSVLHLNKKIVDGWVERWDEDAIDTRGTELAEAVIQVWPSASQMR